MEIFGWIMVAFGGFMILLAVVPLPRRWRDVPQVGWELALFGLLTVVNEGDKLLDWPQWITFPLAMALLPMAVVVVVRRVRERRRRRV
ncbi:hypothetical protein [Streptomyces sp. NBC_00102]|uniref:hypothetical protein n=1 Tax=Streptomyces sp. NBC_00102 TaxID=2975652 RepID=UPI002259DD3A|nr:hypothetical protein [Streptomyces sp. NBC_00102]MCX5397942.1 hypothetical protein [Streptomyces sp. NBC_00102]